MPYVLFFWLKITLPSRIIPHVILCLLLSIWLLSWTKNEGTEPITTYENSNQPTYSDGFITDLARNYKTIDEFDLKLKKQGVEMPDYFVRHMTHAWFV